MTSLALRFVCCCALLGLVAGPPARAAAPPPRKLDLAGMMASRPSEVHLVARRYEADRAKDILLAATRGIDEVMKGKRLDALMFPGANGAAIAAKPGYPTVIVPFGMVPNAPASGFPAGFDARPQPFGVSFSGMACSEPRLLEIAYAFEQATKRRVPPLLQ